MSVRPANIIDALPIAQIQAEALVEALSAGLEKELSEYSRAQLEVGGLTSTWMSLIANPPSEDCHVLVADENGEVAGVAAIAPADPSMTEDDDPNGLDPETGALRQAFEITNFDIPARYADNDHGARMLAAITDIAREAGATEVQMWAIAGHDQTTRLLDSCGFAPRPLRRVMELDGGEIMEYLWWTVLD